jgi:hypothetical protein
VTAWQQSRKRTQEQAQGVRVSKIDGWLSNAGYRTFWCLGDPPFALHVQTKFKRGMTLGGWSFKRGEALHDHSLSEVIRISIACVRGYLITSYSTNMHRISLPKTCYYSWTYFSLYSDSNCTTSHHPYIDATSIGVKPSSSDALRSAL